jgi:tetratricopeptide (TPR) repeat protein
MKVGCALAALLAALGVGGASLAQPPASSPAAPAFKPPSVSSLPPCHAEEPELEKADTAKLQAASAAAKADGYAGIRAHADDLHAILAHAPAGMKSVEVCGEEIVVRSTFEDFLLYSLAMAQPLRQQAAIKRVSFRPAPVIPASLLLGVVENEDHHFAAAYAALSTGLAVQPQAPLLATEAATALTQLGRNDEAVAVCDAVLANPGTLTPANHARLLRSKGSALEGEKRWDEATESYKASLVLTPGNPVALNELAYIGQQRSGAPPTPMRLTHGVGSAPAPTNP